MKVYPKGVEAIGGNHPGLILISEKLTKKTKTKKYDKQKKERICWKATEIAMRPCYPLQTHSHKM